MNEYNIKIRKLDNKGISYEEIKLSLLDEEQLSSLLSAFFSADFTQRQDLITKLK